MATTTTTLIVLVSIMLLAANSTTIDELEQRVAKLETAQLPIGTIVLLPFSTHVSCPIHYSDAYQLTPNTTRHLRIGQPPVPGSGPEPLELETDACTRSVLVNTNGYETACRQNANPAYAYLDAKSYRTFSDAAFSTLSLYVRICIKVST